jgi:hypothetical protein
LSARFFKTIELAIDVSQTREHVWVLLIDGFRLQVYFFSLFQPAGTKKTATFLG